MKTKRGIELDLKESNYFFDLYDLRFFFSSELYLNKFRNNVLTFIDSEILKLKNRYKVYFELYRELAISYYKKIEKRGFRIYDLELQEEISEDI